MFESDSIIGGAVHADYNTRQDLSGVAPGTQSHPQFDISNLIPNRISECSIFLNKAPGEACMSGETAQRIGQILNINDHTRPLIEQAKQKLSCATEKCVISSLINELGEDIVRKEINTNLKIKGPTDNKLLSNVNIDSTLQQWAIAYPEFFPYSFNMLNYASYSWNKGYISNNPDTLATILWQDLYNGTHNGKKYKCAACVINSDTYQGAGKHWMALFADARGDRWTVEFFNSSGNAPAPEWVSWMVKTKTAMENLHANVEILKVSSVRHQKSKSECGLYSLFYIWARLNGVPPEFFMSNHIPDSKMFEFRQHLFDDPSRPAIGKFDWREYQGQVKIEWE